jgi:putative ABC transport system permease protein
MNLLPVLRTLGRMRGLSLAVVGTLALGLGALTITFMLVDGALWRAPPFPDAGRIAALYTTRTSSERGTQRERWSFAAIKMLREQSGELGLTANYSRSRMTLTGGGAESVIGEIVSPSYFAILRALPLLGRTFVAAEDVVPGAYPVVVLSHDLWSRRFGADSAVLGRTVHVNGVALSVVGVLRPGFRGLTDEAQLWLPTMMAPYMNYAEYLTTDQSFISVIARLRDGLSWPQAVARVEALGSRIYSVVRIEDPAPEDVVSATAIPLNEARVAAVTRRSLMILFGAVTLLYLLACANALNLLLERAATRRREAAIRAALGGAPVQLLRHFVAEGVVLVTVATVFGLFLTWGASKFVTPPTDVWGPRNFYGSLAAFAAPSFDLRTLVFALALAGVTMLLVAWAPAATAARVHILPALQESSRSATSSSATLRRPSLRGAIVALEAALALLLLVGGGLMINSFVRMRRTDLGVDAERVLTFWVQPSEVRVPVDAAPAYINRLLDAIAKVPGVEAATVDGGAPVAGSARSTLFVVGRPVPKPEDAPPVLRHYVGPDHFRVLGVPLLGGRAFTADDRAGQPRVAIISASAARTFWPGQNPIGQRIWFGSSTFSSPDSSAQIVGIVADVVHEPLDAGANRNDFYTPYMQFTYAARSVMVRTAGEPLALVSAIRNALQAVDPDLPMLEVQSLPQLIGSSWARQRFDALLFGAFAALALLLSTSGIYAVVSYAVNQRTRELGIRMALGAQPPGIVRMVVGEGLGFPVVGLLIGLAGSLALGRLLQAALYETRAADPFVLGVTVLLLLLVSALACLRPALRATRVDPLTVLRSD